jgi:hypothetical protein
VSHCAIRGTFGPSLRQKLLRRRSRADATPLTGSVRLLLVVSAARRVLSRPSTSILWRSRGRGAWHDSCVVLVASATLYGLFSAWLLFPLFDVRRMLRTSTTVLMWLEFLAVLTWGYTREDCARGSCNALAKAASAAVAVDLPALATAVVALAVADAVRRQRGSPRRNRATEGDSARLK